MTLPMNLVSDTILNHITEQMDDIAAKLAEMGVRIGLKRWPLGDIWSD